MSLVDKVTYKKWAGIDNTDTCNDDQLQCVLDMITDAIEGYLDRNLEAQDYKTWIDGSGCTVQLVDHYPMNNIYYCAVGDEYVGEIEYTGSSNIATAQFDGSTLTLIDFASGVQNTNTISVSSNITISAFKTAVDAVSDWSMTIQRSDRSDDPSEFMRPIKSSHAVSSNSLDVRLPFDGLAVEVADKMNRGLLISPNNTISGLFSAGSWPKGLNNVFVWYNAGYVYPTDADQTISTVPNDLTLAACQMVKDTLDLVGRCNVVTDYKLADYAEKLNPQSVSSVVMTRQGMIDKYRRLYA